MELELKIRDNLHFLIMEVLGQLSATSRFLSSFDQRLCRKVLERDGYIDNLCTTLENDCYALMFTHPEPSHQNVDRARATHTISTNLKQISDFSSNIVRQVEYLLDRVLWLSFDASALFHLIEASLEQVAPSLEKGDIGQALAICHCEFEVDRLYIENFNRIMEELRRGKSTESYVTILFIFRYIERIGDSLLNIGEAILSSILGERIRIREFDALQQTLANSKIDIPLDHLQLRSYWGTRSGCNISKVADVPSDASSDAAHEAIFKTGSIRKIEKEKEKLDAWADVIPGLAPRVLTFYRQDAENGALLTEFLPGNNLQEIVLGDDREMVLSSQHALHRLLGEQLWVGTKKAGATETSYMAQVMTRLESVHQVHSYLRKQQTLGHLAVDSTATLVEKCLHVERLLPAPFSVFIHGDFNANNILYDAHRDRIFFIDVNRSGPADYIQDVSVFLVSNFRLPVFGESLRQQINLTIAEMYGFARNFAKEQNDTTFDVRLTLALARSLYTSTRFQLNTDFVKEMVLRANFLLEKVIHFNEDKQNWQDFQFPEEVLYL
ncbi:phosphotransferase [Desulfobulbus rhabdoformis]|uniref:PhoU domain-containing protein n=1 Tax=Desulfobulbus rhabdoformis TaxID=34032 RepID=UPI001963975A|nr:PhoU domain-containing protein [Desulfobulbus rhabdoformis]MBM9615086.1 phosphotransferase [Desulfobulbus rhabdoformis]